MRGLPKFDDPNLIVGTEDFSDAAVYRLRDDLYIVQSLDFFPPLVDDPFLFGQIAAANSMSDIYAMGAKPTVVLNIVGFPDDKLDLSILNEILRGGAERVLEAGAVVAGGHTVRDVEIKFGLSVTGVVTPENLLTNSKAKPGDTLVLTKPLGTGYVTTAFKARSCPDEIFDVTTASMTLLNASACEAAHAGKANASTDITGFGLAGHAGEMAQASKVTLEIELSKLPLIPGVEELVSKGFKTRASASNRSFAEPMLKVQSTVDDMRLEIVFDAQTSGGLLLSVPAENADTVVEKAKAGGASFATVIGSVKEKQEGISLLIRD